MNDFYLVTRILEISSYSYINTEIFGDVEIRSHSHDLEVEKKAFLKATEKSFGGKLNLKDYDFSNRISVIVEASDEAQAVHLANEKFIPVLDLKATTLVLANINLSKFGMVRNLGSGEIKSFIINGVLKSGMFMRNLSSIQRWDPINFILHNNNHPVKSNELSSRYIKSVHWSHHASDENNKQLKVIFNYFCLEALFKENENDNITALVRCFLGFPSYKQSQNIDSELISSLKENDSYKVIEKEIPKYLDEIRILRNKSVHAGFRSIDICNQKLTFYDKLLNLAKSRCLRAVEHSIIEQRIETLADFKNNFGDTFNNIIQVKDILNTVVYSLNNDSDNFNELIIF